MGVSLGKSYNYNMSESCDDPSCDKGGASSGSSSKSGDEQQQPTTICGSWRTRSENWSKKRRNLLSSSSSKDFFGRRNKKWGMRSKGSAAGTSCGVRGQGEEDEARAEVGSSSSSGCVCTMYRRTDEDVGVAAENNETISGLFATSFDIHGVPIPGSSVIDLSRFNPNDYPIDDEDERMRQQRAREMQEGVELTSLFGVVSIREQLYPAHSQMDFVHYLVPDLKEITNCSFYWGKIDRYEAEKLLEGKPEGTFLLRDSAQEEYLFSVSFRRYNRSLHARIEQWNNQFSFDSHDPSVYSSCTVTGLIEHYKDPSCCMFFEPMLTTPLHRNFPFGLQHLSRAAICPNLNYDSINALPLPKLMKMYLKEYHYKQRVRVRPLE